MRKLESRMLEVRVEAVTASFVAAGQPEGIHDLGRFLENLNNPAVSRQIELNAPTLRPLYRASDQLCLDTPLLIRRDEIVFANFEGPSFTRGSVRPPQVDAPVLLLAPPFQIQGTVALAPGSDPTQALRAIIDAFFVVRHARVFDADGNPLGEGDQIVVNGAAVQMTAASRQHIDLASPLVAPEQAPGPEAGPTVEHDASEDDGDVRRAA